MEKYLTILKNNNLKITPRRRAVLDIFINSEKYLGPYQVRALLIKRKIGVGLPSVYRILEELCRAAILVEIEHADKQLYYGLCRMPQQDHHHFICTKCNKIQEVEFCNFDQIANFISKKLNACVQYHALRIEGLCSVCK